jgi:hypothetical protein
MRCTSSKQMLCGLYGGRQKRAPLEIRALGHCLPGYSLERGCLDTTTTLLYEKHCHKYTSDKQRAD